MTAGALTRKPWDGKRPLTAAVLVDVDGTLAGVYRHGRRPLRPSAPAALELLSRRAPVFLWSVAGAENAVRLLIEHPAVVPWVSGCWGKQDFPLGRVGRAYCIDDQRVDAAVAAAHAVFLVDCYQGGHDSGALMEAAEALVRRLAQESGPSGLLK